MTPDPELEPARAQLQSHIQRTVARSALKKIRGIVDEYEEEERIARRFTPIGIALVVIAIVAVVLTVYVFRFAPGERTFSLPKSPASAAAAGAPRPIRLDVGAGEDPVAARYGEEFRTRIEDYAAFYYPGVIREKRLYGVTTLATYIRSDGTVDRIEVRKSSGLPDLDDAAQKLVMRASPFPPFTDELKKRGDTIVFTREFSFVQE
jgi:TonB family protein